LVSLTLRQRPDLQALPNLLPLAQLRLGGATIPTRRDRAPVLRTELLLKMS
jgi:hypothetical protein